MKPIGFMLRSLNGHLSHRRPYFSTIRSIFTVNTSGSANENKYSNTSESVDDFEKRIFEGYQGNNQNPDPFFQKLDNMKKARRDASDYKWNGRNDAGGDSQDMDPVDEKLSTLADGMDRRLKEAASNYFEVDMDEINSQDYCYRPDITFRPAMTYEPKDLDLTKSGVQKPFKRQEFETTTEEVLEKADFRNVRFLANFITESGIIIKRSQTRISAKAQRKVAREIKTARAFGLMPFTTMGQYPFVFGKSREDFEREDEQHESYAADRESYLTDRFVVDEPDSVLP